MKLAYDFHIHTAASPCGDAYMSPHNIVNMAKLNELDMIAITDHNTCVNCKAVMKVGEASGVLVMPGMEIECMEEFHSIAVFPTLDAAYAVEEKLKAHMMPIKNKINIFGNQHILDENDEVVGEIETLLLTAIQLPINEITDLVKAVGGIIYPAHIDRNSYSIISNLGQIPEDLKFECIEISKQASLLEYAKNYSKYKIICSSDAHYLQDLSLRENFLEIDYLTHHHIIEALSNK
ncbi:MAG: PHP domain-containing protein [Cellulosilyticaceae bacterium]